MKRLSVLWTKDKVRSECRFHGNYDPLVANVSFSSKTCTAGSIFIAVEGLHVDGHSFIPEAIERGAVVVVHSTRLARYHGDILYIRHPNPRRVASMFAYALSLPLPQSIIGVTGTDGKSTTCEFLWKLLNDLGTRCGLLSTVSLDDGSGHRPSPYRQSTPEVPELYAFLRTCRENGVSTVVLEATSHGLSETGARLADISFAGAVYTSLTSEHLEFHKSLDQYIEAKMNLARQVAPGGWIVLPKTFPYRRWVASASPSDVREYLHALDEDHDGTALSAATLESSLESRSITVSAPTDDPVTVRLPYGPSCFSENALGAMLAAHVVTGQPLANIAAVAHTFGRVPGRFDVVRTNDPCTILIDFAHTADAFERLFEHVRSSHPEGRLVAVFGAAGERDSSKRLPMGKAAGRWCDVVFLTDEDPRKENPSQILTELQMGIESAQTSTRIVRIHDRRCAIQSALDLCNRPEDVLLLLGKGHEGSIQYADGPQPWNERKVVEELLAQRSPANA
ncbi:MAG TPA: UDP-N-acetylmuramoyl-L-alanyl-D-glutamate--2,6-diaminopimelate ligase [Sphaerochaeta sp.]|nr:UDP-N-acetylmuramoyl-L-alanyl-D-glutamate--2,6-diaminopimelate ligase [Sphaerochaeta sp.]